MPAVWMTLRHFSVSVVIRLVKSAGEPSDNSAAELGELCLECRIGEARVDFLVK